MTHLERSALVILLLGVSACGGPARQTTPSPSPLLEVRLAYGEPGEARERRVLGGEVLYLAPDPVVSDVDLTSVRPEVERDENGPARLTLAVRCSEEAHERLLAISAQHMDQRMAILFNGEVKSAPVVKSAVGCRGAHMGLVASESEAEQMAELIRARWQDAP